MYQERFTKALIVALALTGILAINSSAAHAKWVILKEAASVLFMNLVATLALTEFVAEELGGTEIHCTGGLGNLTIQLNAEHKILNASSLILFDKCSYVSPFNEVCSLVTNGKTSKEIFFITSLTAGMSGFEDVYFEAKALPGSPFTTVKFEGEECPITELDGEVTGSFRTLVDKPLQHQTTHKIDLLDQDLLLDSKWEWPSLELRNAAGSPLNGSITEQSLSPFSFHLVGL